METKQRNKNLIQAKRNKNDEFYTVYEDVANELEHYGDQLKNKAILCPCDYDFYKEFSKEEREKIFNGLMTDKNDIGSFSRYLYNKQDETNPEKGWNNQLYFSHYNPKTNDGVPFEQSIREFAKKHPDGIIITNPPFSLFNKFMEILQETNIKFLIMGNKNSIIKKEIFELIKEHKIWLGYSMPQSFKQPNGDKTKNLKGVVKWFTNLDVKPRKETMSLTYSYYDNPDLYPKYDNYDAINIDKTKQIPYDYDGYMGVPFTFLEKYNPEQFEILGITATNDRNVDVIRIDNINTNRGVISGKELYARIIIKNKNPELNKQLDKKRFFSSFDKKALLDNASDNEKQIVNEKIKYQCKYCLMFFEPNDLEIDHIKPWSKGGQTDLSNAQLLCKSCNVKKSNK